MTVALAPYSHDYFQSLPNLNTARDAFIESDGPKLVEEIFRPLFTNSGMDRHFGLAMMHRHSNLRAGQIMVTYNNTSTPWNATPGEGMDKPQPMILGLSPEGKLVPTEFRYSKGHKLEIGEKELAFAAKLMAELDKLGLRQLFGLREYPGDDFEGTCEITEGLANINLKPKDYPDGLVQTDTAWYFSETIRKRGCRCTCDNRTDPHGHGAHVITQSG
ncbi:hypothetical protein BU26DRAFT_498111 [Trematosphaeria pertusa]|uniref:Uncharacterized protein n=1 Tax=Trematosphaeria pertusa TaxID=390896 RepID=A0A6A6HQB5_9PLEO|nr:uncharacterized protein BU26DRAFT_498111 [Trematosphaeria pertusa]KAF2240344.1 hypothetical protein BU26DRAFT_498111 [Trematosphaeria pertusa]